MRHVFNDKRIDNTKLRPELLNVHERDMEPEDGMQEDILLELPPSAGYQKIITAIDVISRQVFVYPVSNPSAVKTAKVIIHFFKKAHTYLHLWSQKKDQYSFLRPLVR